MWFLRVCHQVPHELYLRSPYIPAEIVVRHAYYRFLVTNLEDRAVLSIIKDGKEVLKLSTLGRSSVNHQNVGILLLLGPYECMYHLFCRFYY